MVEGPVGDNPHAKAAPDREAIPASAAHVFRKKGRRLLFDAATRVTFELDRAGEAAARVVTGSRSGSQASRRHAAGTASSADALEYVRSLQGQSYFGDHTPRAVPLNPDRPYTVIPVVSRRCNLRCRYCFLGQTKVPTMSRSVMQATAAFIADLTSAGRASGYVGLGPAGEPTVALAQYDEFLALLAEQETQHGVSFPSVLSATNLTTMRRPSVRRWVRKMPVGTVSLDGPPEVHDALRVRRDGTGSYADVIHGLEIVRQSGANPAGAATLTALHPDVSEIYFHLFDVGFPEVVVKPVRAHPRHPWAIGQNLEAICAAYERFVDRLLALPDEELLQRLLAIAGTLGVDYFGRFLTRVIERHVVPYRCAGWIESVAVDTDGQLYGCVSLLGVPQAHLGSVWDGIDEARVQCLADRFHVSRRVPCSVCWARLICGGGCMHQSYLTYGEFGPPDPAECKLNRHLIELAIWVYAELQQTRPRVLAALPNASRASWRETPPAPCGRLGSRAQSLREWVALRRAEPSSVIHPATHLKRRLLGPEDDERLEIRLAWDPTDLYLLLSSDGPGPERLREGLRSARLGLFIPTGMGGSEASSVPVFLNDLQWALVADPSAGHITYEETPRRDCSGQILSGGLVATGPYGCFVRIPWREVSVPSPEPGMEFGMRLVLHDAHGGELEWQPYHDAGRVRLVSRRSGRWREATDPGGPAGSAVEALTSHPSVRAVWSPKTPRL